ncbi:coenzyme F420-0:L-glutamate ligase [Candidatus Kaiserbacteria bacterium]|nr:coenzyme F420-0:L-glutamate ligase [Candidatus Kaiserbacteria bacterium]
MKSTPIRTSIFTEDESLAAFIVRHIPRVKDGSILAVASKIVALSEGRTADVKDKEALIVSESTWRMKILPKWWLTVRDGVAIVNAGIDESNSDGRLILLPEDCFKAADQLRKELLREYGVSNLGIVITDSRVAPLRAGVTGVALGYAGFRGVRDYRGERDIFGKQLEVTQTNVADSLATVATLLMGEGAEQQPLVVIEDVPVQFAGAIDRAEVLIPLEEDMYRRLFSD